MYCIRPESANGKPLKRLGVFARFYTQLKQGVNGNVRLERGVNENVGGGEFNLAVLLTAVFAL
jgi:hypothetical protein